MKLKYYVLIFSLILVVAAGCAKQNTPATSAPAEKMEKKTEKESMKEETMLNKKSGDIKNKDEMQNEMAGESKYANYSEDQIKDANSDGKKVVLFFHASWCPNCKTADEAFKNKPDKIPKGVVVLKTDYDSNKDLKTKYGVTTQHTFVQIDQDGKLVTKWVGGDIEMLIKNIQ